MTDIEIRNAVSAIDDAPSVDQMYRLVSAIHEGARRQVILSGLATSKFQAEWAIFAEYFGVPEGEWPPAP